MRRWMLLNDKEGDIVHEIRVGGWFARSLDQLREFIAKEVEKATSVHPVAGLFKLIYGWKIDFRLVPGGARDMYNDETPLLTKLKKSCDFVGDRVFIPVPVNKAKGEK